MRSSTSIRPTRTWGSRIERVLAGFSARDAGDQALDLVDLDAALDGDALDPRLLQPAHQLAEGFGRARNRVVAHDQVVADDADRDRRQVGERDRQRFGQCADAARHQRVPGGVELRRAQRGGETPDDFLGECGAIGAGHRPPSPPSASRAALRTPRLAARVASSSAARVSGEPMRLSAAAAALRRSAVRRGAHHSPRSSAARSAVRGVGVGAEPGQRVDDGFVQPHQRAARRRRGEHRGQRRHGAAVAQADHLAHDQLAGGAARFAAAIDHRERLGGADLDDGAHGVALYLRVGVVEQQRQLAQRVVAAEDAQQVHGGAAHGRLGRVLERLDGTPPLGAERDQQLADAADGVGVVLGGERLGERQHQPRPNRLAHPGQRLRLGVAGLTELGDDVAHQRPLGERVERRVRFVVEGAGRTARCAGKGLDQPLRSGHVAQQRPPLDFPHGEIRHAAPVVRVGLDRHQIERQLQVEVADRRRVHRGEPRGNALRRVVRQALHLGRLRARGRQLAGVVGGHEALVRVVEHHHRALPHLGEARVRPELGVFGLGAGLIEQRSLAAGIRHEGFEHLGQPLGRAALGRHRLGDDGGDGPVVDAVDHALGDGRVLRFGRLPVREQPDQHLGRQVGCGARHGGERVVHARRGFAPRRRGSWRAAGASAPRCAR